MGLLLALSSSDMWRGHLHRTNFTSCDAIMAGGEHLPNTITYFSSRSGALKGPGDNNFSGLVLGVNRLKRLRCHSAVKLILLALWSRSITPLYHRVYRPLGHDPTSAHTAGAMREGISPPIDTRLAIDWNKAQASGGGGGRNISTFISTLHLYSLPMV